MSRRGLALFAAMCVVWGIPYLFIKIAVRDLSPAALVLGRTSIAALLLLPLAAGRGALRPLLGRAIPLATFAAIEIAIPWWLLAKAETQISSSLTALLIAAVPLIGAVLALAARHGERLGARAVTGLGLGMAGVATLVGLDTAGAGLAPIAAVGGVAFCYALGPILLDRYLGDLPAIGVIAGSLALAALVYVPIGATQLPDHMPSTEVLVSVGVLAVVCTALAFLLFFALIATIGPVRATVITYVNPAVAALAGVAFLGETFTAGMGIGFVLILAGSVLATHRGKPAAAPETSGAPA
jgi:drug/metabolite transporter (DMT)-like permease